MAHLTAQGLLDLVLDEGSFESWDEPVDHSRLDPTYQQELRAAAERAGTDESVLTGRGLMRGRPVAVVVNEFRFLAGSIGRASALRIVAAVRRATAEGIPVLATTASGGTRMQEGTPAFVHMVDITRAIMDHRAAGLPYLIYLRHPTTGGVFASWGSLAHITIAEPGALIGFLGPKVYEIMEGKPFPPGVQVAENLADRGIIDAVVLPDELPLLVDRALSLLVDPPTRRTRELRTAEVRHERSAWESIQITRGPRRAGVREVLRYGSDATVRLQGTEKGERDSAMIVALARIDGQPCVVIGQDRTTQTRFKPMGPAALREARRGMRLANELRLPLVSFIDTPGAELSPEAEQGAIAGEIARCISWMSTMTVPTVSVLLGQGCGGGALALLPADVVIAAENAWLSPLPPEGASAIVHGDLEHAAEMAAAQRVGALDLLHNGTVHHIVPEPAGDTPEAFARAMAAEIGAQLVALRSR
ncbi:acetyl-CoA carboxyl transferase [Aeromicrobium sp. SMF47]|uniref:Acetyl-CoA carboxyl transferase n=1 Tax=Aeromicrobium yanjiei TaxID=2662028 RepID=A0A5Q2MCR4_9ACTN|nr:MULTISPECIES: carboxyl transferase domain-containing protein [Aeromicrobium]MRJ75189.1 acetyl-CoA carboxyl transferase [Aeromicrobium yanjiei]MRK02753.1 acetyl-CoA carboxyl transferase [Aeromicrobium sp. S22]QGG40358.1 acetyl-CoA carboxyl transferase [Aeromicrobium yanjiei]